VLTKTNDDKVLSKEITNEAFVSKHRMGMNKIIHLLFLFLPKDR
jgi:hypothetical protein